MKNNISEKGGIGKMLPEELANQHHSTILVISLRLYFQFLKTTNNTQGNPHKVNS